MLEAPGCAAHRGLAHSDRTGADRETKGMGWSVEAEEEELAADGAVDVQCSRVAVVEDGAEAEDPAGSGGDDAASRQIVSEILRPRCKCRGKI